MSLEGGREGGGGEGGREEGEEGEMREGGRDCYTYSNIGMQSNGTTVFK